MSNIPNDKRALAYGSAFAIQDTNTVAELTTPLDLNCVFDDEIIPKFLDRYDQWIKSTNLNTLKGLDNFPFRCYSSGTTEGFDKFYQRNHARRFRCFRGEYMYHKLAWRDTHDWCWLEDDGLDAHDAVIISLPFADTGDKHSEYHTLLERCSELKIPVLVDCAYFGICQDIEFDFSYDCITDITFSLSKIFPVAYARIGMRYSKEDTDDTMFVYHKIQYNNKIGAALGLRFLEKFATDYIASKYKQQQLEFCKTLEVKPSKTVLFGLGGANWAEYNRGGPSNRLSFHKQFIKGL